MGRRRKRRTELLHRGSLDNCHLCGRFNFLTIRVLSVVSLILWALILIVTVKYVLILLRADNNGEGGTLALMALAQHAIGRGVPIVFLFGVISVPHPVLWTQV